MKPVQPPAKPPHSSVVAAKQEQQQHLQQQLPLAASAVQMQQQQGLEHLLQQQQQFQQQQQQHMMHQQGCPSLETLDQMGSKIYWTWLCEIRFLLILNGKRKFTSLDVQINLEKKTFCESIPVKIVLPRCRSSRRGGCPARRTPSSRLP